MHILKSTLVLSTLAMALTGCMGSGSNPSKHEIRATAPECVFPDSPQDAAPAWVCDAPVEGVAVSAVGSREKAAAGIHFMKEQAAASARTALAQQMRVKVSNMVKQFAETTGAASTETVDKVNTSVSKLITDETIKGSRLFRSVTSPKGSIYVLVGLDRPTAINETEKVLKTSMGNDSAQWQQFKAQKGQDELAAAIAAQVK